MKATKEAPNRSKKIRKGDTVMVISGNCKGQSGEIMRCQEERVLVQGLNLRKKHVRKQGNQPGQILSIEAPIHASNVRLMAGEKPVKLKVRVDAKGERSLSYKEGKKQVDYRPVKKPKKA